MALKRLTAVFNDYAAAERVTYELSRQQINVKDLAFFERGENASEKESDDVILSYATAQFSGATMVMEMGRNQPPSFLPQTAKEKSIVRHYKAQMDGGQIIWTAKATEADVLAVYRLLDRCGAVQIEKE